VKHLDLFSGIGGAALAVEAVWEDVEHTFCEIDPFCQAVLKKHFPKSKIYGDIKGFSKEQFIADTRSEKSHGLSKLSRKESVEIGNVYILTGGFPCQPFSQAGRRKGTEDDRHLWPEMLRIIRDFRPTWVVGENVAGLLSISGGVVFEQVCADLEEEGYQVQPFVIPAVAVNAPHRRDRVWIVANYSSGRCYQPSKRKNKQQRRAEIIGTNRNASNAESERRKISGDTRGGRFRSAEQSWESNWFEAATELCIVDDGLPNGLARPRGWRNAALKGAGNAWVPQVAIEIFRGIREVSSMN
jgi:DNA (cytosine-5)-methyltransferase 1